MWRILREGSGFVLHERPHAVGSGHDDVLMAVQLVRDGTVADRSIQTRVPERVTRARVERNEIVRSIRR